MAQRFNAEDVTSIYMGLDKVCRCGCKGDYQEPGDPMFAKRLKRFMKLWEDYTPGDHDDMLGYKNISYGNNRALTVYFKS